MGRWIDREREKEIIGINNQVCGMIVMEGVCWRVKRKTTRE